MIVMQKHIIYHPDIHVCLILIKINSNKIAFSHWIGLFRWFNERRTLKDICHPFLMINTLFQILHVIRVRVFTDIVLQH